MTESIELANDALVVGVLPELGGKIAQLRSRATGRQWLWRNPHLPWRRAEPGDSYVALHDTGGIDECFPEVHGEVFGRPWSVKRRTAKELALSFTGEGWRLARTLRLGASLALEYALENRSARARDFVWCVHALFAVEPGMRLELPGETRIVPAGPRPALKEFVGPLARGEVALRTADGRESLHFAFDPCEIPFVGLWQNYGGWAGVPGAAPYFNLGIEPSIGDADALDEARARGTAGVLEPGARRTWRLELALHTG